MAKAPILGFVPPAPLAAAADGDGRGLTPSPGPVVTPSARLPKQPKWSRVLQIVVFAKYTNDEGKKILEDIAFLNHASGDLFNLIFAGYSRTAPDPSDPDSFAHEAMPVAVSNTGTWFFNPIMFHRQVAIVEELTTWEYKGGTQLLICDVAVRDRQAAGLNAMFRKGRANLSQVITLGVEELKDKKIIDGFDGLFNIIRSLLKRRWGNGTYHPMDGHGPTWHLSDDLGLKSDRILWDVLGKVFELKWPAAALATLNLRHLAIRDISRADSSNEAWNLPLES